MNKRAIFAIVGFLVITILIVMLYIAYIAADSFALFEEPEALNPITRIEPPLDMPDFTLTNQQGESINLSDLRGKPVLLTFGFTHCLDVCPITLGEMRKIHNDLDNLGDDLHFVFVSVDGERDTPEVLSNYFTTLRVDSFIIGMTGTENAVREMGIPYGLDFRYDEADALGNYTVEHTAGMFLLNSEGQWIRRYTYGMESDDIVTDLRDVIQ